MIVAFEAVIMKSEKKIQIFSLFITCKKRQYKGTTMI